jgi:predicted transcriptional regulator
MKTLSEQLRRAIVKSGVSRYEIAKQTGVSQAALSRFVLGHRGISGKAMDAVGLFLGLAITTKKER